MDRRMVAKRSGQTARAPRSPLPFTRALVADVIHRCELWTLLECHAVGRAARSANRDVRTVRAVFPELNKQLVAPSAPADWQRLELRLHRAITEQAGNALLSAMAQDVRGELEGVCARHIPRPIHRPG